MECERTYKQAEGAMHDASGVTSPQKQVNIKASKDSTSSTHDGNTDKLEKLGDLIQVWSNLNMYPNPYFREPQSWNHCHYAVSNTVANALIKIFHTYAAKLQSTQLIKDLQQKMQQVDQEFSGLFIDRDNLIKTLSNPRAEINNFTFSNQSPIVVSDPQAGVTVPNNSTLLAAEQVQ
jgi:hypothetical protein